MHSHVAKDRGGTFKESLHVTIRKTIKTRGPFPNDEAATKLI